MSTTDGDSGAEQHVETSPNGRYIRYNSVLGRGSYKTVYKAFDTEEALEVAWNKLHVDRLSPHDLEKVSNEVALLRQVDHKNIIHFYDTWPSVDAGDSTLNFITEQMMSGTLKEYLKKAKAIKLKVIRRWCANILEAIAYLHTRDPPIMHRDLKCDNIFINGHVGEVKIGDLGLSGVKEREKADSVIGTPEFMAPELYEESYTEKVDIYAFGMCLLEMVSMEYPYSECNNMMQIFRKVFSGRKPQAYENLLDGPVKEVIGACLEREESRPSAVTLLQHPLFRDWDKDEGTVSNLSLVKGKEQIADANLEGDQSANAPPVGTRWIDWSEKLQRDVLVKMINVDGEQNGEGEGTQVNVLTTREGGDFRIGLEIPMNDAMKRVEFNFNPFEDSPEHIAMELITEFHLSKDMRGYIRSVVDREVQFAKDKREALEAASCASKNATPQPANRLSQSEVTLESVTPIPEPAISPPRTTQPEASRFSEVPVAIPTSAALAHEQEIHTASVTGPASNDIGTSIEQHERNQHLVHEGSGNHLQPPKRPLQSEHPGELLPGITPLHRSANEVHHDAYLQPMQEALPMSQSQPEMMISDVEMVEVPPSPMDMVTTRGALQHTTAVRNSEAPSAGSTETPSGIASPEAGQEFRGVPILTHSTLMPNMSEAGVSGTLQDVQNTYTSERVQGHLATEAYDVAHEEHLEVSVRSQVADVNAANVHLAEEQVEVPAIESVAGDSTRVNMHVEQMSAVMDLPGEGLVPHSEQPHRSEVEFRPAEELAPTTFNAAPLREIVTTTQSIPPGDLSLNEVPQGDMSNNGHIGMHQVHQVEEPVSGRAVNIALSIPPGTPPGNEDRKELLYTPGSNLTIPETTTVAAVDIPPRPAPNPVVPVSSSPLTTDVTLNHMQGQAVSNDPIMTTSSVQPVRPEPPVETNAAVPTSAGLSHPATHREPENTALPKSGSIPQIVVVGDSMKSSSTEKTRRSVNEFSSASLPVFGTREMSPNSIYFEGQGSMQEDMHSRLGSGRVKSVPVGLKIDDTLKESLSNQQRTTPEKGGRAQSWKSALSDESTTTLATRLIHKSPLTDKNDQKFYTMCLTLMDHCAKGNLEEVVEKVKAGADPTFTDYDMRTPLHIAAAEGHERVCAYLLENGAQVGARDRWNNTPLGDALEYGHMEVQQLLKAHGAVFEKRNNDELLHYELMRRAASGDLESVRAQIVAGADVNRCDYDRRTPLHLACSEGHAEVAELLLVNSAKFDVRDRKGRSPVDDAVNNGHRSIIRVLRQYGANVPRHLFDAQPELENQRGMDLVEHAARGRVDAVQQALNQGADPNFRDYDARTPLHLACVEGRQEIVRLLLQAGASVNVRDRWGFTPIGEAKKYGHNNVAEQVNIWEANRKQHQLSMTSFDKRVMSINGHNRHSLPPGEERSAHFDQLSHGIASSVSMGAIPAMELSTDEYATRFPSGIRVGGITDSISSVSLPPALLERAESGTVNFDDEQRRITEEFNAQMRRLQERRKQEERVRRTPQTDMSRSTRSSSEQTQVSVITHSRSTVRDPPSSLGRDVSLPGGISTSTSYGSLISHREGKKTLSPCRLPVTPVVVGKVISPRAPLTPLVGTGRIVTEPKPKRGAEKDIRMLVDDLVDVASSSK